MALIQTQKAQMTKEEKQIELKRIIQTRMTSQYWQLSNTLKMVMNDIYSNKELTPQDVVDAFGTEAAELFKISDLIIKVLNEAVPGSAAISAPYNFEIKEDGTVIIGDKK